MTLFNTPPPPPPPPVPSVAFSAQPKMDVKLGATLVIVGGLLTIAGSFLNWVDLDGETFNGFTDGLEGITNVKGVFFDALGALAVAFGLVQLTAKRKLAIGIVGAATSAIGLIVGLKALSDVDDLVTIGQLLGLDVSTGPGLYVAVLGSLVAIAGSILTVAKKRA